MIHVVDVLENSRTLPDERMPYWKLKKANWKEFNITCALKFTPAANVDNAEYIIYFTKILLTIAEHYQN